MKDIYKISTRANAKTQNIYKDGSLRISFLTSKLVRLEWSDTQTFIDSPTQTVWFRDFEKTEFSVTQDGDKTVLQTAELLILYTPKGDLRSSVEIKIKNPVANWNVITGLKDTWRYGDTLKTLPGTARTLDNSNGEVPLEQSIISRDGFSVLDDSTSCIINADGTVVPRGEQDAVDVYFFAYGHDYKQALCDYLSLTGKPPLLPKWALGNWWSRYHKYTQQEYLELMDEFKARDIPLSVAMVDMDWHITEIDKSIGSGWTGYTWNKKYFPDHKKFLCDLHSRGLKVSLNLHPAEGVGRHEDAYKNMSAALKKHFDGKTIPFDIADSQFAEAYFEQLHHPLEKDGVDFWWVDWQQGTTTQVKGLDPLWVLNHYHYLDNAKNGKRPLILSRYAGPGSQRYPVGFSGDTVISWKSLAFQPYFTASAGNIGYGWWSHDIGGHMMGTYDEELQVRWVQFGVFSPIMRLHSSSSRFNHKEPWKYSDNANAAIKRYMQLRHKMLPYLYTMNGQFAKNGVPLLKPLYYENPEDEGAYCAPNEYWFGSEMIACPVTVPEERDLKRAPVKVWLPAGKFTDIFSGVTYAGGRALTMYRPVSDIPVLLKEGGIVPLASDDGLEILVASSADGAVKNSFTLYDDDGETFEYEKGKFCTREFNFAGGKENTFTINAARGEQSLVPEEGVYKISFLNAWRPDKVSVSINGKSSDIPFEYDWLLRKITVKIKLNRNDSAQIVFAQGSADNGVKIERCAALLDSAQIDFIRKEKLFEIIRQNDADALKVCQQLLFIGEDSGMSEALLELLQNE